MSTPVVVSFALVACYVLLLSGSSASAKKNTPSPKRMPTSFPTIASAAKAYKLNTLVKAVSETPLSSAVNNGATAVTLFAPTDKAFAVALAGDLVELHKNLSVLSAILQYHVLGTPHPSTDVPKSGSVTLETLLKGQSLTLSTSGNTVKVLGAFNRSATVTIANIKAGASYIHIIDTVLLPSSVIKKPSQKYLLGDSAPFCDCDYHPGGCQISTPAPPGKACQCNYKGFWTCSGNVVDCLGASAPTCTKPDTSLGSCYQGQGDCGAYSPSCDCDYHSGGCSISQASPPGTACHCNYKGFWSCSGNVVRCNDLNNPDCISPSGSLGSCQQGGGDCGAY